MNRALRRDLRGGQLRDGRQRRLRGVEAETEILVRERRVYVARLVPRGIPPRTGLRATFVFTEAERGNDVHEWRRIGVRHVRGDVHGIVGGVFLAFWLDHERQLHGLVSQL